MGRIGRSLQLVKESYRILMQDKELMLLPLISGVFIAAVAASFVFTSGIAFGRFNPESPISLAMAFVGYVAVYAIGIFFQAAVVAGATERMRGGDPTVMSSLGAAWSKIGAILAWAVVAATVGMILRAIQERAGFIGRIIVSFIGAAWSLATFFVVPILVLENITVRDSVTKSVDTFKRTWGETMVGSASIGVAAFMGWIVLVSVTGLLAWAGIAAIALPVFFLGALLLVLMTSALQGVYLASLYQYATTGTTPNGFSQDTLSQAFVPKRR